MIRADILPPPIATLVTPCFRTPVWQLERLAASIAPVRDAVEWIVVDDTPESPEVTAFAEHMARRGLRLRLIRHAANLGIVASYLDGFAAATGRHVGILDHDDEVDLAPLVARLAAAPDLDLLYCDEAKFRPDRTEPFLKPDFDPLSALHWFYMHHVTFFRADVVRSIAERHPPEGIGSAFDIWLALTFVAEIARHRLLAVEHLDRIAYGWRVHAGSTAASSGQKPALEAERLRLAETIAARAGTPLVATAHPVHTYSWTFARTAATGDAGITAHRAVLSVDGSWTARAPAAAADVPALPIAPIAAYFRTPVLVVARKTIAGLPGPATTAARQLPHVPFLHEPTAAEIAEIADRLAGRPALVLTPPGDTGPIARLCVLGEG